MAQMYPKGCCPRPCPVPPRSGDTALTVSPGCTYRCRAIAVYGRSHLWPPIGSAKYTGKVQINKPAHCNVQVRDPHQTCMSRLGRHLTTSRTALHLQRCWALASSPHFPVDLQGLNASQLSSECTACSSPAPQALSACMQGQPGEDCTAHSQTLQSPDSSLLLCPRSC